MTLDANAIAREYGVEKLRNILDVASKPRLLKGGLATFTAAELSRQEFPPVSYVIPDYVAEGLTILAGRPKTGKSWLALGWAISVSTGGISLGSEKVVQGDVLYLALEDNQRRLKRRLEQTLQGGEQPARLHMATECPRIGAGGVEALEAWCDSVPMPRLIVADVFGKIRPDRRDKHQSLYDEDYKAIEPLKRMSDEREIGMLIVHHTNKREEPADPFDSVSGSTGLSGAADTVLVLSRSTNGTTLYGRGRDIEEVETALSFNKETGLWTSLGTASEAHRSDERNIILTALKGSLQPLGPQDIAGITNLKPGNVRRLLGKMVASGEIEKAGYGSYRVSLGNSGYTGNSDD